ncbi:hypothetical protein ABFU27_17320 [Xanthomonas campestris pv. raphani]|uniref:hypothetical protein n=1 Tax=Xanthomonas campestris TaxID=339 RepID=UPI002B233758|nr:hypothetical protein [Xanthomonas campestris]MEA9861281.1 hypothetical protein [Xanthomonas campestris pv. raphani]MEA9941240.1 hypothetical protein [Xanthomonas campestris pv. raphani]
MLASGWISTATAAQTPASRGVILPLYAEDTTESLGVPELRDTLETGETLIYDVSEPCSAQLLAVQMARR